MQIIRVAIGGEFVTINVCERPEDMEHFRDFIRANLRGLGFDTETTGLDIYMPGFRLRLAQFGSRDESFVVPVELFGADDVKKALRGLRRLVIHNASFDVQVVQKTLGIPMSELWPKVLDSKILAHLADPRGREEGGTGNSLEDLTRAHLDAEVADNVKGSMLEMAREIKVTKGEVFKSVDTFNPTYLRYSGLDPILAVRVAEKVGDLIKAKTSPLIEFEHELAAMMSQVEATGYLLDEEYTRKLSEDLAQREAVAVDKAQSLFGIDTVNSTDKVADALERAGVTAFGVTPTGKRQIDKALLNRLISTEEPKLFGARTIAEVVVEAKKARKWRTTWVDGFLAGMDVNGRCHANINSLRARTARMSITGIPAQTLPAGDWLIRRCFIADEGHITGAVDYKSQELRITAGLSGDIVMLDAFERDLSLHLITAQAAFGEHVLKDSKEYKAGKGTNFAVVFGGGWKAVHDQFGVEEKQARNAVKAFWATYPAVKRFADQTTQEVRRQGGVYAPSGRWIPVDANRPYAGLNYKIQETGRMVTARGLLRLNKAGYTPYIRLPIHDEAVLSLPKETAQEDIREIGLLMQETFGPVLMDTDTELGKRSWGSCGYGATE